MHLLAISDSVWVAIIGVAGGVLLAFVAGLGWLLKKLWAAAAEAIEAGVAFVRATVSQHMMKVDRMAQAQETTNDRLETIDKSITNLTDHMTTLDDRLTRVEEGR